MCFLLLIVIGVVVEVIPWGASTSPFISWGRGYKEDNRVSYNMIPIRTLSLLDYFTYIFIDILIYALVSTSWFSGIFWMVGRVVTDPSLGLSCPCDVVPHVLILVTRLPDHSSWKCLSLLASRQLGASGSQPCSLPPARRSFSMAFWATQYTMVAGYARETRCRPCCSC
jgi:hypothetical protein